MNPFLFLLQFGTPGFLRRRGLSELFAITAQAFGVNPPDINGLRESQQLEIFARFTEEQAQAFLTGKRDVSPVRDALYTGAYRLGGNLRRALLISSPPEVMECAALLYRTIGIEFRGSPGGKIMISRCSFSRFYSPETCRLISALDEGILAGLSGKGRLAFESRITEGNDCCRAYFGSDGESG
jgi:hypothetical protein